ncbi:MAG: Crp/Fnr family transcriptional regulator [Sphingobacteriales bacterium]|nr:MAG: Crp/Fnr family transcriptional regulator [Sphingobacteriales bacterium]
MTIREYMNENLGTTYSLDEELPFCIKRKTFKKGEIITPYDKVESCVYFLKSGIVEFTIEWADEEKIIDFYLPGNFIAAYTSFLTQQASDVQIRALADCETEIITYQELQQAYTTSVAANRMGRFATEAAYLSKVKREKDFLTKTAEERYVDMLEYRPELIAMLPINKIARYLGIHPESLSRIRRKISYC